MVQRVCLLGHKTLRQEHKTLIKRKEKRHTTINLTSGLNSRKAPISIAAFTFLGHCFQIIAIKVVNCLMDLEYTALWLRASSCYHLLGFNSQRIPPIVTPGHDGMANGAVHLLHCKLYLLPYSSRLSSSHRDVGVTNTNVFSLIAVPRGSAHGP